MKLTSSCEQAVAVSNGQDNFAEKLSAKMPWDTRDAEFFRFPNREIYLAVPSVK
jgi:hypothetical protein